MGSVNKRDSEKRRENRANPKAQGNKPKKRERKQRQKYNNHEDNNTKAMETSQGQGERKCSGKKRGESQRLVN